MAGELRLESPGTYIGIPTLHALLVAIQRSCLLSVARLHSTRWPEKTSQGASRRKVHEASEAVFGGGAGSVGSDLS